MFEIGSYVVYRSEGVCVISDIRTENFGGTNEATEYYILTPISDKKSTVFVPVHNSALTSLMNKLLSAREFSDLIQECKGKTLEVVGDGRARTNAFREVLSKGERKSLILLLNTLYERFEQLSSCGKKAGSAELAIYAKAQKLIYEELATTTNIQSSDKVMSVLRGETQIEDKE